MHISSDLQVTIEEAIRNKRIVSADYDGYERLMCPHLLGRNKQGGLQALFYQFGGTSSSGLAPEGSSKNWKCMILSKLSNVSVINGEWKTGPSHAKPSTCVVDVIVEVDY